MKKSLTMVIMFVLMSVSALAIELDNSHVYEILTEYDGDVSKYVEANYDANEQKSLCTNSLQTCIGCSACTCTDDDENDYLNVKGNVESVAYMSGIVVVHYFTDLCSADIGFDDNFLLQVSCDNDAECNYPKWTKYECDCTDGTCPENVPEFGAIGMLIAITGSLFVVRKKFTK